MITFNKRRPNILVVDDFYKDPEAIIEQAESLDFVENPLVYKGTRTKGVLMPYVKEEFERLLGVKILDWLNQPANGAFQKTLGTDPLVYHSDSQDYAAAVYLTKDATDWGTSFWQDTKYGYRRPPETVELCNEVYSQYNILHPDNWKLIDKVGGVYNRLVIWDAKMIHSASMYGEKERLVQLYFFNIEK